MGAFFKTLHGGIKIKRRFECVSERLPIELRTEVFIGDVRAILMGKKYL